MIQQFSRLGLASQDYLFSQIGDSQIPQDLKNHSPIVKIDSLVVHNFKSFDKKYVGPFLGFSCIIGPNGAGKSNILDALMFCFCSESARHTLADARELINRHGKQSFKELSKIEKVCSVETNFILQNGQKFQIKRNLDAEGKEEYFINYKIVTKKLYQNILLQKGINSLSPNYAIWQGEIDRLVLRDPTQLTNLLEQLCGSIYLKKQYDNVRDKLHGIQAKMEDKTKKVNKLKLERKNLKVVKQTNTEFQKYDQQYQEVLKKIYFLAVLEKKRSVEELEKEITEVQKEQKEKINQINQTKKNAQKDFIKKKELQQDIDKIMGELAEYYTQVKNVDNPANVLKIQKQKEVQNQLGEKQKQIQQLKQKRNHLQESVPEIPSTALIEQYLNLYQKWQSDNFALHRQITKKKSELLFIEGVLQSKCDVIKDFQLKKQKHSQKINQKRALVGNMKSDIQTLDTSIKKMQSESAKFHQEAAEYKTQFGKKKQSHEDICSTIEELQSMISDQAQDEKQAEMLKSLANIQGFHGVLHQKIKPTSQKYSIAFSTMVGGMSKYLLCSTQESAKKIGNRLRQLRLMKNVIILNNIHASNSNSTNLRKQLGKDAVMAVDIIDYDHDTLKLKDFIGEMFYGKVVCDHMEMAYRIRNRNIESLKQIYTLDGSVIRKDGIITSYGNPESLKKLQKFTTAKSSIFTQLTKLNKQKQKIQTDLNNLQFKFNDKQILARNQQIRQMNQRKEGIIGKLKQIQTEQSKDIVLPHTLLKQINDLEKEKDKLRKLVRELEKQMRSSKIFDQFMKKNQIQDLERFRNANDVQCVQSLMRKKAQIHRQLSIVEGNIQKLQKELTKFTQKARQMELQVRKIPAKGDKSKIQDQIKQKQKDLTEKRAKISKLTVITRGQTVFQTNLPVLQAKFVYAKQKLSKDLEQLANDLGIEYEYPIADDQLLKQLNLPRKITNDIIQSVCQKLQQERKSIEVSLDKHNTINLLTAVSVQEDEERIQKSINSLIEDIEQIIEQRKKCVQEIAIIRKDRSTLLNQFINELQQNLIKSYRILTEQEDGSVGTVNLHVQNSDQPFQRGVYFTPTPPTKRFVYDLEQLSGGQKSVASLALQYSLSVTSKSPFLILDQTDAFLDTGNVHRFLKLVDGAIQDKKLQIIVITHKQGIFSKCDSLVGVSRPKSSSISQIYSLNLNESD